MNNKVIKLILEDFKFYGDQYGKLYALIFSQSLHIMIMYRLSFAISGVPVARAIRHILTYLIKIISGCEIPSSCIIGKRFNMPHPNGIIIGRDAVIGDDVCIYHMVTLGLRHNGGEERPKYPTVCDRVTIYANSMVLGGVVVGEGSTIGAFSLVLKDVNPYVTSIGIPAKILK